MEYSSESPVTQLPTLNALGSAKAFRESGQNQSALTEFGITVGVVVGIIVLVKVIKKALKK